jgi:comEA protein
VLAAAARIAPFIRDPTATEADMRKKLSKATTLLLIISLLVPAAAMAQKAKPTSTEKVNINTASVDQLETLPGVGPAMAKKIVEHRSKNGKFSKVEEILNIKGIGEKKFQKMKDRLTV